MPMSPAYTTTHMPQRHAAMHLTLRLRHYAYASMPSECEYATVYMLICIRRYAYDTMTMPS